MILEARPETDPWSAAWESSIKKVVAADSSVSYKEAYNANTPTDAQPVIQQMLGGGYGVMLMTSYTLTDVAKAVHTDHPDSPIAVTSFKGVVQPNLNVITASYLQMGYVNCWLLTKLSKSGKIGYVNGQPVPFATEMEKGCKLGAAAAGPSSKVLVAYTNSFSDQQAAATQARSLVSQGADVLWPASGETDALGAYQYCEQQSIPCAGWGGDTREWAPKTGVITAQLDWSGIIEKLVKQYRAKNLKASDYDATYANGGIVAPAFTGASAKLVPASVRAGFATMLAAMKAGKITLPASSAHPGLP